MAIKLQKGQTINLSKDEFDLSQVTIGLGWDVRKAERGFLSSVLGGGGGDDDYDLDAIAFLLDQNGKVASTGDNRLVGGDVVFFNSLRHPSGAIWLTGDNRTGDGDGDDEQIICLLNQMPLKYDKILFVVSIYQGIQKKQSFGMVENAFIRAVDAKGREMMRFDMSSEKSYSDKRSVVFAELYRKDGGWKFRAIGEPEQTDSFVDILRRYV